MGSRVVREAPKDVQKKKKRAADRQDPAEKAAPKRKAETGSLMAAGAAILTAGYLQEADPTIASNFLLPAVSGALLGTTCIWPGRPSPGGTFVATYFLVTGYTGLEELGFNGWVQQVFYGVALVAAVGVSALAARKSGAQAVEFVPQ